MVTCCRPSPAGSRTRPRYPPGSPSRHQADHDGALAAARNSPCCLWTMCARAASARHGWQRSPDRGCLGCQRRSSGLGRRGGPAGGTREIVEQVSGRQRDFAPRQRRRPAGRRFPRYAAADPLVPGRLAAQPGDVSIRPLAPLWNGWGTTGPFPSSRRVRRSTKTRARSPRQPHTRRQVARASSSTTSRARSGSRWERRWTRVESEKASRPTS